MKNDTAVIEMGVTQHSDRKPPRTVVGHSARRGTTKNGRPQLLLFEQGEDGQVRVAISLILDETPFSSAAESKFKHPRERAMAMLGECGLLTRDGSFNGPKWAGSEYLLYEDTAEYDGEMRTTGRWLMPVGSTAVVDLAL